MTKDEKKGFISTCSHVYAMCGKRFSGTRIDLRGPSNITEIKPLCLTLSLLNPYGKLSLGIGFSNQKSLKVRSET